MGKPLRNPQLLVVCRLDEKWELIHKVSAPANLVISRQLLLPNFDIKTFPFMVHFDKKFYYIVNVMNLSHRDKFVKGSARNDWRQAPFFFIDYGDDRLSFNFCVSEYIEKKNYEKVYKYAWHQLSLNVDFTQILKQHKRLPV